MNNQQNRPRNEKILLISLLVVLITLLISLFIYGYAKFTQSSQGNATAVLADLICEMDVQTSTKSSTIINPYCTITVKNTKTEGEGANQTTKRTGVDITYRLEVVAKDNIILPEHYWVRVNGATETIIARSVDVLDEHGHITARTSTFPTQNFGHTQNETAVYKIVFLNPGNQSDPNNEDEPLERMVDFNLIAIQKNSAN